MVRFSVLGRLFLLKYCMLLKLNDPFLFKIRVFDIVNNDGWDWLKQIELKPVEDRIELTDHGVHVRSWQLYEHPIGRLGPVFNKDDGSFVRERSPQSVYYVVDSVSGQKFRLMYFKMLPTGKYLCGTRKDLGARWASRCMSKKERQKNEDLKILRIIRRKKWLRKERKLQKKLRGDLTNERQVTAERMARKRNKRAAAEWERGLFINKWRRT